MAVFKRGRVLTAANLSGFARGGQPKTPRHAGRIRADSAAADPLLRNFCETRIKAPSRGTPADDGRGADGLKPLIRRPMDVLSGRPRFPPVPHSSQTMTPSLAFEKIRTAFVRMDAFYGRAVFDEWAVLAIEEAKISVLAYEGPRAESFTRDLHKDLVQLRNDTEGERRDPGAFGFTRSASGQAIDAYIVLGPSLYLICNNTDESVSELALDPHWRKAQVPFAELAELFRHHPLAAVGAA